MTYIDITSALVGGFIAGLLAGLLLGVFVKIVGFFSS
jgi:predicted lipid-binding transport protein (Tim44 family)